MSTPVKYRPPRRINVVSVTLSVLLALGVYLAYQYLPLYLQRQEAYRVLEEHGSVFAGHKGLYSRNPGKREGLRRKMEAELRRVGIDDPEIETWIEVDMSSAGLAGQRPHEARLGVVYSRWIEWPFDVIARQEQVYELEHVVDLSI